MFADDILMFSTTDEENLKNLSLVIKMFEHSSGLKVNLHKSLIAGVNVETVLLQKAKELVNVMICIKQNTKKKVLWSNLIGACLWQ